MSGVTNLTALNQELKSQGLSSRRILIVADTEIRIKGLTTYLRQLNYDVQLAFYNGKTLSATPVNNPAAIVCCLSKHENKTADISRALKSHYNASIPVIAVFSVAPTVKNFTYDSVVVEPAHNSQIANRVNGLLRLSAMEREIALRVETLQSDFNKTITLEDDGKYPPFRILFIGKATPSFMVVMNALQKKNVDVIAAFTSFSAFDYLHESKFDAVVMNTTEEAEPALSISTTMRRNASLYHVPTIFISNSDHFNYAEQAHKSGATDIININSESDEISGRILELANYYRLHENIKNEFAKFKDDETFCTPNGCFNKNFFDAHSERVLASNQSLNIPVTMIAIQTTPQSSLFLDEAKALQASHKIGSLLKSLVRMQDTVSHYDTNRYLILLPDTHEGEANSILTRVKALLECTVFDSGTSHSPLTIGFAASIHQCETFENASSTISKLLASLDKESQNTHFQDTA